MAKRSLKASVEGIRKAKQAFKRKGFTQQNLATEVGLETRQPIWKFFTGKAVDRQVFHEICFVLELNPEEVLPQSVDEEKNKDLVLQNSPVTVSDINTVVEKVRAARYEKVQSQCGTLNLLDVASTVPLEDLYVDVSISEEISGQRWVCVGDLQNLKLEGSDSIPGMRLSSSTSTLKRLSSLDAVSKYSKLTVLGKPGSGKTTFLQFIATRCNKGLFEPNYVPIFIRLKYFTEDTRQSEKLNLTNYLIQEFLDCGVSELDLMQILTYGRVLILLDGLDEVNEEFSNPLIQEIRYFCERFYNNKIVITCRVAALQYRFKGFNEVEIADFNREQIASFVEKWFINVAKNTFLEGNKKSSEFMYKLELPENEQIRELATTPILLNLTCLVFQSAGDLLIQRSQLYKQGLELLLIRWDEARGIRRDEVYRNLSLLHKLKMLSSIAFNTFSREEYFFSTSKIQKLIADYLSSFPGSSTDIDELQLESEAVLKSIEAQHGLLVERARGVYSFSHLTFQEYLTAREIVNQSHDEKFLRGLIDCTNERRWREIFLLVSQMLQPADDFLNRIKQKVDNLICHNHSTDGEKLQDFLAWIARKSSQIEAGYNTASVKAFYFTLALPSNHSLAGDQSLALSLDKRFAQKLKRDLELDMALSYALSISLSVTPEIFFYRFPAVNLSLDLEHLLEDKPNLKRLLQQHKDKLPLKETGKEALTSWWRDRGQQWTEDLRKLTIGTEVLPPQEVRLIGYQWDFNAEESMVLQKYWDSTKLLVDCLKSAVEVTSETHHDIKERLFTV